MKKYNFSADPFSRAFLENRDKTMNERVAAGMLEAAHYLPITFPENCMLPTVGTLAKDAASGTRSDSGFLQSGRILRNPRKKSGT